VVPALNALAAFDATLRHAALGLARGDMPPGEAAGAVWEAWFVVRSPDLLDPATGIARDPQAFVAALDDVSAFARDRLDAMQARAETAIAITELHVVRALRPLLDARAPAAELLAEAARVNARRHGLMTDAQLRRLVEREAYWAMRRHKRGGA
jgi:hypothetical protein